MMQPQFQPDDIFTAPAHVAANTITPYHAKYYAHEITAKRAATGVERLSQSLAESAVDLNPHQIEAALFALRSPLSKGVILADEVGLGKTIEAGLLLCQYWAENKRRLLIICPAALRRQWSIELEEKFKIPSLILENKAWQALQKSGHDPLVQERALILSYQFASRLKDELRAIPWDLCVVDEAHKLRNLYKKDNKIGRALLHALGDKRKVLLTATPLQNSLMELYGLAMLVDERIFGSEEAFRENYVNSKADLADLKTRLRPFVHRTLRRDVLEYIKYTNREAITVPYIPSAAEEQLYELLSAFILRDNTYSIPLAQRKLVVLVIRKLLSSSTYAIIGTLKTIKSRLLALQQDHTKQPENLLAVLAHENELDSEYEEETEPERPTFLKQDIDPERLSAELAEIDYFIAIARSITVETKAVKLLQALETGFARMRTLGALEKVIIFTESNRTQRYLQEFLEKQPAYAGTIVTFNGQNNEDLPRSIYKQWCAANEDTGRITGARDVDMRQALVDHFREHGQIMIATEAAAEGLNLQFCSLLVNYDLPWNPQRVEQRIGRCHRYGQKFDVVVINFLNEKNWADQRIYELLRYKFKLFDGVFGASDEVLGRLEDGLDFEKRLADIFETCRTPDEIEGAFTRLQQELEEPISEKLQTARQTLFEHFDEDVHQRLKLHKEQATKRRDEVLEYFWELTKYILIHHFAGHFIGGYHFDEERRMFGTLQAEIEEGHVPEFANCSFAYRLAAAEEPDQHAYKHFLTKAERRRLRLQPRLYKPSTPLGQKVLGAALALPTNPAHLVFDYASYPHKISVLEEICGKTGWLIASELKASSFEEQTHLVLAACDAGGTLIPTDALRKLFRLPASIAGARQESPHEPLLEQETSRRFKTFLHTQDEKNGQFFAEEMEKLDRWADDQRTGLKATLRELDEQIKDLKRTARQTGNLPEKLARQKDIRKLEAKRDEAWRAYDESARVVEQKKDEIIDQVEKRLKQKTKTRELFRISFEIQ